MEKTLYFVVISIIGIILYSCASIGRPTGGPQDEDPPVFLNSNPLPNALNVTKNKIELEFNELVQLKDQNDKVVVSPVQKEAAQIRTSGKKITIEFRDTLQPNTTYSIDFADAIQDFNEGNPIEGFSYAFSTGDSIDTLQISGMVLNARNLEPQQKVLVGIHTNLEDSAFNKIPFARIARTNDRGQFTIRNLKPGKYRIFALNDMNGDYKFDNPSEDIAFYDEIIVPTAASKAVRDTIFTMEHEIDTIVDAIHTSYFPNDILLSMFNEEYKAQYLTKNERLDKRRFFMQFAAPADTLPLINLLGDQIPQKDWYIIDKSKHNDTLTYWITDTTLFSVDSLKISATYLRTDSTQNLSLTTDTLQFNLRKFKTPKKNKKDEEKDSLPKMDFLALTIKSGTTQDVYLPIGITMGEPVASVDSAGVRLEIKRDSIWEPLGPVPLKRDNGYSLLNYSIPYEWEPGAAYQLVIDSASIHSIYGLHNKPEKHSFTVRQLEEYSNLFFNTDVADSAFVELLNASDDVVRISPVINSTAEFMYLMPGTYYARLFKDRNGNGKYDTGKYDEKRQPEEVYYYPKKLVLKKNWDVEQPWNIDAIPIDQQKPEDIKKNKPAEKKNKDKDKQKNPNNEEEEEEDPFGQNIFQQPDNNYINNNNRR